MSYFDVPHLKMMNALLRKLFVLRKFMQSRAAGVIVFSIFALALGATAGSLTPSASPGATMHTLSNIWDVIASATYDSSAVVANQNGSLLGNLKYIESQLGWASGSNNIWNLNGGNVGIGTVNPTAKLSVEGNASVSGTLELTNDGTLDLLKFTESDSTKTYGMVVRDGDFFIRAPSISSAFSSHFAAASIASDSLGWTIGTPASPVLKGSYAPAGAVSGVYISGKYAYVAAGTSGLLVIDVSDPSNPNLEGSYSGAAFAYDVNVSGRYAYVADRTSGLRIIDISNPSQPTLTSTYDTNNAYRVYVSGKYAYVADDTSGLLIIDVSNPASPILVGSYDTGGNAVGVYVSGRYAYVADNAPGLVIIDISNPSFPTLAGTYDSGTAANVYVSGKYAYVADILSGLKIVDVSDPTNPSPVGTYSTPIDAQSIYVSGKYAYTVNYSFGLQIINVTNPTAPVRISTYDTSGNALGVYVSGKYAYVADGGAFSSALRVIDIGGVEAHALSVGNLFTSSITVQDNADIANNLYVRNGLNVGVGGLLVNGPLSLNASYSSNVTNTVRSDLLRVVHSKGYLAGDALRVDIAASTSQEYFTGNFARFSAGNSMRITFESSGAILASGASQFGAAGVPSSVSYSRFGTATTGHSLSAASDLLLAGLFEVDGSVFLDSNASVSGTLELTNDGTLDLLKLSESDSTKTYGMVVRDGDFFIRAPSISSEFSPHYVLASVASNSLSWTIGTPASPSLKGVYDTGDSALGGVYVSGKFAYVVDRTFGLYIIDISNPASPSLESVTDVGDSTIGVHVSGRYAYVVDQLSGLHIIDISNPVAPILLGNYNTPGNADSVHVSGRYAYVADHDSGLHIIDISNPSDPALVGTYNTSGIAFGVYVSGKYAYVADQASGLQIIDISNPSAPALAGTYNTSGIAFGVYVSGKYAYVADQASGLQIIDISNARTPSLIGTLNTLGSATGVYISGRYAYVTASGNGLQVIDISHPETPVLIGTYSTSDSLYQVFVSGNYAYMSSGTSGLRIVDIGGLETHALYAGNISTNDITVYENADIGNDLHVRNGLGVGSGGLLVNGPFALNASYSSNIASVSRSDLLRVVHSKGYLAGDALRVDIAASTSQEYFTGNFARFSAGNSMRITFESSGAILASGASQFGAAGVPSSASYSRFGTATTGHALAASSDLLLSGMLEVNGQVFLDASASISSNLDITGTASASKLFVGLSGTQTTNAVCHPTAGISTSQELVDCDPTAGDYMELYPMDESIQEGEIVMPDPSRFVTSTEQDRIPVLIRASNRSQALGIVSVASKASDFNSVGHNIRPEDNPLPVALNGRVKVRISMENGPISVGDPLMLSSTPGTATKATTPGFILGTALDSASADGSVMVFVNPTYWAPEIPVTDTLSEPDGLFASILAWFRDTLGITFGEGRVRADRLESEQLCVGSVCVTEEQFMKVFGTSTPAPESADIPIEAPTPEPESPIVEESVTGDAPEQTPDASVADEPVVSEPAPEETSPAEESAPEPAPVQNEPVPEPQQ